MGLGLGAGVAKGACWTWPLAIVPVALTGAAAGEERTPATRTIRDTVKQVTAKRADFFTRFGYTLFVGIGSSLAFWAG